MNSLSETDNHQRKTVLSPKQLPPPPPSKTKNQSSEAKPAAVASSILKTDETHPSSRRTVPSTPSKISVEKPSKANYIVKTMVARDKPHFSLDHDSQYYEQLAFQKLSEKNVQAAKDYFKIALEIELKNEGTKITYYMQKIGVCLKRLHQFKEALQQYEEILQRQRNANMSELILARILNEIGFCWQNLYDYEKGLAFHNESLSISRKYNARKSIIQSLNNMGTCLRFSGKISEALGCYKEALSLTCKEYGHHHFKTLYPLIKITKCLIPLGKYQEALEITCRDILKIIQEQLCSDAMVHEKAIALNSIGRCLRLLGNNQEALEYHKKALSLIRQIHRDEEGNIVTIHTLNNIGKCLNNLGLFKEALEHHEKALKMRTHRGDEDSYDVMLYLHDIAYSLTLLGNSVLAHEKYTQAIEIQEKIHKQNVLKLADGLSYKATCLVNLGKYHSALLLEKQALQINEECFGKIHPKVANSLNSKGTCYYSLGQFQEAYECFYKALKIHESLFGTKFHEVATALTGMGNSLASLGETQKALELHQRALSIRKFCFGDLHYLIAESLINLASCLSFLQLHNDALLHYQKALNIRLASLGPDHPNTIFTSHSVSICSALLEGKRETQKDSINPLSPKDFNNLVSFAKEYLQSIDQTKLKFAKNPTGFVRLHVPVPVHLKGQVDSIRLNYWPLDFKVDVVEAQHTHPRYFESMILNGGYTQALFKTTAPDSPFKTTVSPTPFRAHRMFKNTHEERNIFFVGTTDLQHERDEKIEKGTIVRFPKTLIHQVITTQPETLSINCVFKDKDAHNYFDIFIPVGQFTDPQAERETLESESASTVATQILELLKTYSSSVNSS